jgi:hypothetical protein
LLRGELSPPSRQRILDPFLHCFNITVTNPADHLGQDLLTLVLDPGGEVSAPRVVVLGHLDQAIGLPIGDPVANARDWFGRKGHVAKSDDRPVHFGGFIKSQQQKL